ncbi:FAD-dependent oxidoreductase, partial [Halomonas sp. PBN3]|uniref:FAD-dependent oxidoreductase n=1 Tax=Halomonas sp. PBN3 TaxID=1397528 RepID=UPI0003B8257F
MSAAPLTILGSGMAGLGLLRQLRALDAERPVTLITADGGDDYSKPLLSTGFAKGLAPERLAARDALAVADSLDAVVRTHTRVEAIDPERRTLRIGEERLPFGELVLATGAAPVAPFAVPEALAGRVMAVNDLDDYRAFHAAVAALGRPARVAIIGAG